MEIKHIIGKWLDPEVDRKSIKEMVEELFLPYGNSPSKKYARVNFAFGYNELSVTPLHNYEGYIIRQEVRQDTIKNKYFTELRMDKNILSIVYIEEIETNEQTEKTTLYASFDTHNYLYKEAGKKIEKNYKKESSPSLSYIEGKTYTYNPSLDEVTVKMTYNGSNKKEKRSYDSFLDISKYQVDLVVDLPKLKYKTLK